MSPTVEPDPDNAGVGNILAQAVPLPDGLFLFKGSGFKGSSVQMTEVRRQSIENNSSEGASNNRPAASDKQPAAKTINL